MAKSITQVVTQENLSNNVPKRTIIQYNDDVLGLQQTIVNYDDMSVESKAIYDTFIQMCEIYMNS